MDRLIPVAPTAAVIQSLGCAMRLVKVISVAFTVALVLNSRVGAQDDAPQLVLDTGGHMGAIYSLFWTRDGHHVISGGDDKVVRIWDLSIGKTVRSIRGPIGPGNEGRIAALALSPDERWLAVGGDIGGGIIRLYDFKSGTIKGVLTGHKRGVRGLAFSHDGRLLLSGGADNVAILWDVEGRRLLRRFDGHDNAGGRNEIEAVSFSLDDQLAITGSFDRTIKLWRVTDGGLATTLSGHADRVRSLAVSPKDGNIASGDVSGEIRIWDASSGRLLRSFQNHSSSDLRSSSVRGLSFSPNGRALLAGNGGRGSNYYVRVWQPDTGSLLMEYKKHDNGVYAVAISANGQWAATAGGDNKEIHIWDLASGEPAKSTFGEPLILAGTGRPVWAVGVSPDGQRIAWGNMHKYASSFDRGPLLLQLILPTNQHAGVGKPEPIVDASAFLRASDHYDDVKIGRKLGGPFAREDEVLVLTGRTGVPPIEIVASEQDGGRHTSSTFTFDGTTILSGGGTGTFSGYAHDGRVLGHYVGHDDIVWSLAPFADGNFLVSGSGDQTVRLWNLRTRELVVTLFSGSDGEWVLWTPQGYYASSPNGDRIVGWQINKGLDQAAEFVAASQLRNEFYRPDIVERAIVLASATAAVEEAGRTRGGTFQLSDLNSRSPPRLSVLVAPGDSETMRGRADIKLTLAETTDDPVKGFEVFVNDTKVAAQAKRHGADISFDVPLAQGNNRIRVVARSKADLLGEAMLEIKQNGEGMLDKRDTLFIVAVGVDKYPEVPKTCGLKENEPCDLAFAGADAKVFAETVEKQMAGQHKQVVKRVLFNDAGETLEPTRDNIENAFDLLLEAKDNDTVAVFIAGHGYNDPRTGYQFLPTNARPGDSNNWASSSVVKWSVLEGAIQAAKGRRLLFVDTCRSGGAYNARLIKDASDGGIVAFSATNTQQDALELANLGHGVFTHVLVRGMRGEADLMQEKEVRVFDLGTFIEHEVRKLTNGRQTPDFYKKPGGENFVLVRM
jgi:WD40 repeat protein